MPALVNLCYIELSNGIGSTQHNDTNEKALSKFGKGFSL